MNAKVSKILCNYRKKFFFILGCCIIVYLLYGIEKHFFKQENNYQKYNLSKNCEVSINNKKIYEVDTTYYTLKSLKKGDIVKLTIILPENTIKNPVVTFQNENNKVLAWCDGKYAYSYGTLEEKKHINGYFNVKIPITNESSNKKLNIELTMCIDNVNFVIPKLTLINAYECDKLFIAENVYSIYIAIFMILFGVVSIVLIFISFNENKRKIIFMSTIFILAATWIISSLKILELYSDNYVIKYYMEFISLFLGVAVLAFYARETVINKKYRMVLLIEGIIISLLTAIFSILQILGIIYYVEVLKLFHIFLIAEVVEMICFLIKEGKDKKINKLILFSFVPLGMVTAIYMILFMTNKIQAANFVKYIPIVLLLWLVMNYMAYFLEMSERYLFKTEKNSLVSMAYIDPLTGISNRRAYEEKVKEVEEDTENDYIVVCFDINNLKMVNDNYGHKDGDMLIKSFAINANEVFGTDKDFIGRTGGDEFISILLGSDEKKVNEKLEILTEKIQEFTNKVKLKYPITYAVGYYTYKQEEGISFEDAIFRADENMYEDKRLKKLKKDSIEKS